VRRIRAEELATADEVLVQSSRRLESAVTHLDGTPVAGGGSAPGPVCRALFAAMHTRIAREVNAQLPPTQSA
jgi:branched-subunit amino acid aminotransferase/4-amino-4-deoxychorismate lyase